MPQDVVGVGNQYQPCACFQDTSQAINQLPLGVGGHAPLAHGVVRVDTTGNGRREHPLVGVVTVWAKP